MKVDIGIIGALENEVEELISLLEDSAKESVGGIDFYVGSLYSKRVAIAKCGVGKVFAAICAEAMIIKYAPSLVVNTGVGGALGCGIKTTDTVIADRLVQHDMDTTAIGDEPGLISGINKVYFDADARAVAILKEASDALGLSSHVGTVASGDKFIADSDDKERIVRTFSAIACEMEGAAIAHTAFVNNTSFAVIRAISDSADGEASMSYLEFLPVAAKNSSALTLELVKRW